MHSRRSPLAVLLLSAALTAQSSTLGVSTPSATSPVQGATVAPGNGAAGPALAGPAVPASLANVFGNSNNNIPFSWSPTQYQQVFLGSELPNAFAMLGLNLRQDEAFQGFVGQTVDLEINLGFTTLNPATLTTTFASNFDAGAPINVRPRTNVNLPNMPPTLPTDPTAYFINIPFPNPFPWPASGNGRNLLIQVTNRGNSNGNALFTYPLDAGSGAGITTTRLYGFPDTALTGTLGVNYGHVMSFDGLGTTATYFYYGAGCAGTGGPSGNALPASLANAFGNSNNNIPFSWSPTQYQQVFDGSEMATPGVLTSLGLRQDDAFQGFAGRTVDLEINLGYTTLTPATLGVTFASNFDSGAPSTVLTRQNVVLPNMPPTLPTDPTVFFINIPFSVPFPWAPAGRNLLIQVTNRGNSNGNALFTYPLDAGSGITTTRLYGFPDTALTGTLGANYGHVMFFGRAGSGSSVPFLAANGRPRIGTTFSVDLALARASSVAILFTGTSNTSWAGIPLPLNLAGVGAPGCSLVASGDLWLPSTPTSAGGTGSVSIPVPNDASLVGVHFFQQYAVVDPGANALGIAMSRGGDGRVGDL